MLFALWAQLTPLGSAPDEASHLVKSAAVIRGQPKGEAIPGWRLSIDGWAYESTSGIADIVIIADGEIMDRSAPNVARDDVTASLGIDPSTIVGFSIWVLSFELPESYSIYASLNDGRLVPLQILAEKNVLTSPLDVSVNGLSPEAVDSMASLVEDSHLNGRMEYSHWSTYVDIDPQFDGASAVLQCFAAQPTKPGCGLRIEDQPTTAERPITPHGQYPPVMYIVPGFGTLLGASNSAWFVARLVSAFAAALVLALGVVVMVRRRLSPMPLVLVLAPAVVYLASVVNPSGLEIMSAIALWITAPGILAADRRDRWEMLGFALSGLVLILARPLGMVNYATVLAVCVIATGSWRSVLTLVKRHRIISALHTLTLIPATGWYVFIYNTDVDPRRAEYLNPDVPLREQLFHSISDVYRVLHEAIGDLGSLEVPIPRIIFVVLLLTAVWVMSRGLTEADKWTKAAVASLAVLAFLLAVATDLNMFKVLRSYGVQGRHITPLLVGLPLLAARYLRLSLTSRTTIIGLWIVAQIFAGYTALRRYSVGLIGDNFFEMFSAPAWQPPFGIWPTLVMLAVILSIGGYGILRLEPRTT